MKPSELNVLDPSNSTSAGVNLYGNASPREQRSMMARRTPPAVAGFLRATNRALMETIANPVAAMASVKQREPMVDEKVEGERWRITQGYVLGADTRDHGVGDVKPVFVEQQIAEVAETFGLKQRPDMGSLYNLSFLPPKAERLVKA